MENPPSTSLGSTRGLKRKRSSVYEEKEQSQSNGEGSSGGGGGGGDLPLEGSSSLIAVVQRRPDYREIASDEDLDSEEERTVKKHKQEKEKEKEPKKRLAEWTDLKQVQWDEGEEPLGRLPNEILDLVISVDSDLDLRDHLALSATCRYFRNCYRDVVFQVLFQAASPNIQHLPADLFSIDNKGSIVYRSSYGNRFSSWSRPTFVGPIYKSLNAARRIFSTSVVGDGWGVSNEEWEKGKKKREKEQSGFVKLLAEERKVETKKLRAGWEQQLKIKLEEWDKKVADVDLGFGYHWQLGPKPTELSVKAAIEDEVDGLLNRQVAIYGDWIAAPTSSASTEKKKGSKKSKNKEPVRDPWHSPWRYHVAARVNNAFVTKSAAVRSYRVTEEELLALPLVTKTGTKRGQKKYYKKAAVEALSLKILKAQTPKKPKTKAKAKRSRKSEVEKWN